MVPLLLLPGVRSAAPAATEAADSWRMSAVAVAAACLLPCFLAAWGRGVVAVAALPLRALRCACCGEEVISESLPLPLPPPLLPVTTVVVVEALAACLAAAAPRWRRCLACTTSFSFLGGLPDRLAVERS